MTKRQRTLLFLSLLGLFVILAPSLALYSEGYRVDLTGRRIAQTGAFYFKVSPTRADIMVDGNLIKRTDFLFGSALTKNFFSGSYFLEIAKDGYHSWQKILEIKERTVTEAKNILLFKKNPMFQKLADKVDNFWISPNKQYVLLQQQIGTTWELHLLNLETSGTEPLLEQVRSTDEILNIQWAKDSQRFLLQQASSEQIVSAVHSITASLPCFEIPCSLEHFGGSIGNIQLLSSKPDQIVFTKFLNATQVLFESSFEQKEDPHPIANNVVAFASKGNDVFWLDRDGTLWQRDLASDAQPSIFQESTFTPQTEILYDLFVADNSILLKEDTALFLHEKGSVERREILSPALEVLLSPKGDKAAIRNNSELWILFLKEETEQPPRIAGELSLLTRFSSPIQNLSWIDSSYLLFSLENTIRAAEIDNRERLNVVDIAESLDPELFWNNEKGTLYVFTEGAFSVSEKLVK